MIDLIIDVEKGISFSNLTDQKAVDMDGNVAKDVNGMEVTNASVSELRLINNDNSYMIRGRGVPERIMPMPIRYIFTR